jgi:hypothetical protein
MRRIPKNLPCHAHVAPLGTHRTGFCTLGVVKAGVKPEKITMIDQSPHQLAKARKKEGLKGVTILEVSSMPPSTQPSVHPSLLARPHHHANQQQPTSED